jgi:hypothetical protein
VWDFLLQRTMSEHEFAFKKMFFEQTKWEANFSVKNNWIPFESDEWKGVRICLSSAFRVLRKDNFLIQFYISSSFCFDSLLGFRRQIIIFFLKLPLFIVGIPSMQLIRSQ